MPMGLCNSGATFQRLVDITLTGLSYDICMVYIDDVILYSRNLSEQFEWLRLVLARLVQAGLKIKTSKTFLLQRSVSFLSHLVSGEGVRAHPKKLRKSLTGDGQRALKMFEHLSALRRITEGLSNNMHKRCHQLQPY